MTDLGFSSNRLTEEQRRKFQEWLLAMHKPKEPGAKGLSQAKVAELVGSSQSFVNNILQGKNTTVGTARSMMQSAGADPSLVLGTDRAQGRYEGSDTMKARGRALDILSAEYSEEYLLAVQSMPPPHGSEAWTVHQWIQFVVNGKDPWESGKMAARKLRVVKR